ncbi:MAG TPA: hypothetical protein PLD86_16555 [Vicinamibacteria bacterium]|nr:hypothetical protein [Vicinamibacteria bacterium]
MIGERLRRFFLEPQGAQVALEFSSVALVGARVESKRGKLELRSLVSEPLSEGTFVPSLEDPGFVNKEEMRDAAKRVLAKIGAAPQARAALVVPDVVARFRLFAQEEVRTEPKKRDAVIAFRMQKLLPFPAADVRVVSAWPRLATDPVLAVGFSGAVLGAYEQVGQAFGLDVGSVETSSMALLRGLDIEGDALLVRHDPTWLTLTLLRQGWPVSIRSFDATVAQNPDEVRREIASTAVFWRDRLSGTRLASAVIHASDRWFDALSGDLAAAFGCAAERAKPPAHLVVAGMPTAVERSAAPALALLGAY